MKKLLLLCSFFFVSTAIFAQATANFPNNMVQCDSHIFDFTTQNATVLGAQNPAQYTVTYFLSEADAIANVNAIANPTAFTVGSWTNVFVRVTNISNGDFATSGFVAYSSPNPVEFNDETVCDAFPLMPLPPFSQYFSGPNGTGQNLLPGQFITATQTVYIRTTNGGCTVESSFVVTVLPSPTILSPGDVTACDSYVLPQIFVGYYYSGPNGSGTMLAAGDVITSSMTVYIFASYGGMCSSEESFFVDIHNINVVAQADVTVCQEYVLPFLSVGNYYTAPGGTGSTIPIGTVITESTTIYVYASTGFCEAEDSFNVTIGIPGIAPPLSLVVCSESESGFATFNLTDATAQISYNQEVYVISFHETQADAESGTNAITNPTAYTNIVPNSQSIWVLVSDQEGECSVVMATTLTVQLCTDNVISGNVAVTTSDCVSSTPASGIQVTNTSNGTSVYAYTDANGDYSFINVAQGVNVVTVADASGYTAAPSSYEVAVASNSGNYQDRDFCLLAIPFTDIAVYIYPLTLARPGFAATYSLVLHNLGTTTANGTVSFTYDDVRLNFTSAIPAEATGSGGVLNFDFSNLGPSQTSQFTIHFMVEVPPLVNAGTQIHFVAEVAPAQTDDLLENNQYYFTQVAVNSYDPNDKSVVEGEYISEAQADDYLNYIVRFQNTGTASAVNVKITDQLDPKLDLSTFRPIAASHPYHTEMNSNGFVTFRFDDINLPATQDDEPGSHGYIAYQVKPIANWFQDEIYNTANIYFDFNEPITTNTVFTWIVYLDVTENKRTDFAIYPNPTNGVFSIHNSAGTLMQISVIDMQGKTLLMLGSVANDSAVDVSMLSSGIYFVKVITDGKSVVKKLVKE